MEPGELIDQLAAKARAKKVKTPEVLKPIAPESAPGDAAGGCLAPDRHPQMDFFIADIFDAALKDDVASMEHPLFALKAGDRRVRRRGHLVQEGGLRLLAGRAVLGVRHHDRRGACGCAD